MRSIGTRERGKTGMKLEIKNVSKNYGKNLALNGVNLELTPGIYGFLGANGAGKSTLINILTDNIHRTSGEILWDGIDILKHNKEYRKILGYMPQYQGYYRNFSAEAFLIYMGQVKGLDRRSAKQKTAELLKKMNLYDVRKRNVNEFSGGMRQRLMLAQALINDPKILILDEPTAGVDPQERINIRNYISEIAQERIVIIATHIVSDVEAIAKEIVVMKEGNVVKIGTPQELIQGIAKHVFEVHTTIDEVSSLKDKYIVSNLYNSAEGIRAKIIDKKLNGIDRRNSADANLEDVYLFYCS